MFYEICPYCGSDDIRNATSGSINRGEHNSNSVNMHGGVPGVAGVGTDISEGREFTRTTEYTVTFTCANCGRDFDNGAFLRIFERDFEFTDVFIQKYRLITGFNNFIHLVNALESVRIISSRRFRHMALDGPIDFRIKIDRRNLKVLIRKTMKNEGRIIYIMENITGGN